MEYLFKKLAEATKPDNLELVCTQCGIKVKYYCEIVYSQGDKVCLECKEKNKQSDNDAYDRYISSR